QLPLAHLLYEGARSDMRTFAAFLKPVRERLRVLTSQPQQLTLVFDAGASSKANLQKLEAGSDHYVTAVRPSYQQALLAEAADHLEEVTLSTGAVVRAWRTKRMIAGQQRDAVVVFSPQLYAGQVRGLHQHLARCGEQLKELGATPRGTTAATRPNGPPPRWSKPIADSRAWRPLFAISKTLACWLHVRNFTGPIRNCTCMRSCASPPICWCACYGGARVATLDLPVVLGICSRSWRGFASAALSNIPEGPDDRGSANRWKKSILVWKT